MIELTGRDRQVYRELLKTPGAEADDLARRLDLSVAETGAAVARWVEVGLASDDRGLHAMPPQLSYARRISAVEDEASRLNRATDEARAQLAEMSLEYAELRTHEAVIELTSLEGVRQRLTELTENAATSCLSFTPQRTLTSAGIAASRPLNSHLLDRGVVLHSVCPDSMRNDIHTLSYARWLAQNGGALRTVPVVPMQLVIVDEAVALLPIDPVETQLGALEVHSPGMVLALTQLFKAAWSAGVPLDSTAPRNSHGLTPQEAQLVELLADGHTDETAARRLQVSVRTVRRIVAELIERLDAHSRFEAGAKAVARGWI